MDITVDRTITPEGDLEFHILLKNPHIHKTSITEFDIMEILNAAQSSIEDIATGDPDFKDRISNAVYDAKKLTFDMTFRTFQFQTRGFIRSNFQCIYQEVENWVYDAQPEPFKSWLSEFNANKIKYYFNNDAESQKPIPQESEHEIEIDEEDDEP